MFLSSISSSTGKNYLSTESPYNHRNTVYFNSIILFMRLFIALLLSFCISSSAFSQFVGIPALGEVLQPNYFVKNKPAGDNDYVVLTRGELHHATISDSNFVHLEWIETSPINITNFILHDIDQDGDLDIICYRNEYGNFEVLLKANGRYQYSLDYSIGTAPYAIHSEDFNGDGIEDLFINNGFYVTTGINTRERVWRYPVGNPIQYKYTKIFDYEKDGDFDALFHASNSLYVLVHTEEDFSLTTASMIKSGDMLEWGRMITTPLGERLFYYDSNTDSIRQTIFTTEGISFKNMLSVSMTAANDNVHVFDINQDGTEEIILYSTSPGKLLILSYDASLDSMSISEIEVSNPGTAAMCGILFNVNVPYFFLTGSNQLSLFHVESDFNLVMEYSISTALNPRKDGLIDFDGDGYTDIVYEDYVRLYAGMDGFRDPVHVVFPATNGNLYDFDNDGDADYIVDTVWFANEGNYTFGPEMPTGDPTPISESPASEILRIDIDFDGDLDVIRYNQINVPLELIVNNNNEYFEEEITLASHQSIEGTLIHIEVMDADMDGDLDILFVTKSGMVLIQQEGNLNFLEPLQLYNGSKILHTADVADMDADGWIDIVLGTKTFSSGSGVGEAILYKGGPGGWQPQIIHEGNRQHAVRFANVDQTGWKDIIFESQEGLFWVSTENGVDFITRKIDDHLDDSVILGVKDVDQDGDDDAIVYKEYSPILNYYINQASGAFIQSCPQGDIYVRSQAHANRYRLQYPLCEKLPGTLEVGVQSDWTDISDISMFIAVREVQGDFTLTHHNILEDFSGFSSLEKVGGSFTINSYKSHSLLGLQKLRYVGLDLVLSGLTPFSNTVDLSEIQSIDTIGRSLMISHSNILEIEPLIQPVFKGDVRLIGLTGLMDEHALGRIDTIHGELEINRCAITTLDSLQNVRSIGSFRFIDSGLNEFGAFRHIKRIEGDVIFRPVNFGINLTSGFDSLEWVGGELEVHADTCNIFGRLKTVGKEVSISSAGMGPLSLTQLDSIGGYLFLNCDNIRDMQNFRSLDYIGGDMNIIGCEALESLNGLQSFKGPITEFEIFSNKKLASLEGLHDSLDVNGIWKIRSNSSLHICDVPAVCRHLSLDRELSISENGVDCADISEVRCVANRFSGIVFHDFNENAIKDSTEATLSNMRIILPYTSDTIITSHNGFYSVTVGTGDPVSAKVITPDQWKATSATEIEVDSFISGALTNYGNNFGLKPEFDKHEVSITSNQGIFLCSRPYQLDIMIENRGTYPELLQLEINYPEHVRLADHFTMYSEHDSINHIIHINLDTLYPFFTSSFVIPFKAPGAEFTGDNFVTFMVLYDQWYQPQDKVAESKESSDLFCSYDPNDKLVESTNGSRDIHLNSADELIYTIRFQNTGNYYAEHVRITDTISSLLDMSSLTYLASSHPVEIRIHGREVVFSFYNIFLPDSLQDPLGSQGYVTFQIKPYIADMTGVEFLNKADIYFDYNPPIRTNEVVSQVVELTGLDYTTEELYRIIPNPVNTSFYIHPHPCDTDACAYAIYTISGLMIANGNYNGRSSIPVSGLTMGMYFVKVIGGPTLAFVKSVR